MLEYLHTRCTVNNAGDCSDVIYVNLRKAFDRVYAIKPSGSAEVVTFNFT